MTQGIVQQVPSQTIVVGDFLVGVDNGYVVEVTIDPDFGFGEYNTRLPDGTVYIMFHTSEGDEGHLILPPDVPITVTRKVD